MKKYMLLTAVVLLFTNSVLALNLGKLKVPGTSSNTTTNSANTQTITNSATPQQQIINDILAMLRAKWALEAGWVMTGDIQAIENLIASKYGASKPSTNKGYEWTLKPNGDTSGYCAFFKISTPEASRVQYHSIVNETCP